MSIGAALGGDVQIAHQAPSPAPAQLQHQLNMPPKNGKGRGQPLSQPNNKRQRNQPNKGNGFQGQPPPLQAPGQGYNGSPANAAAASQTHCVICKATDHEKTQCRLFDPNYTKNKGKKGAKGGGKKGSK
jgi:hypothetical protein